MEDPGIVKLIAAGRSLQDDAKPVSAYNVGPNTRLLVTKGATAQHSMTGQEAAQRSEEARLAQLERLKATVQKLADRGDGRGLSDKREFSLENQVEQRAAADVVVLHKPPGACQPQRSLHDNTTCCKQTP